MGMKTWRQSGAALSAAGLFLGYLVAVITTRPLGGVVLIGFGIAAFLVWARAVRMEMALKLGGLYVGGGIAPRLATKMTDPGFMEAFLDKGPLKGRVLEKIPVRVIMDPHTALRGAGRYAERLM